MMKNIFRIACVAFLSATFLMTSCKKKEETPTTNNTPTRTDYISMTVNGSAWESDPRTKNIDYFGTPVSSIVGTLDADTLTIFAFKTTASDSSMVWVGATLDADRIGTYNLDGMDNFLAYTNGTDFTMAFMKLFAYDGFSGTLNITEFDTVNNTISGTFTANMTSTQGAPAVAMASGVIKKVTLMK